VRDGGERGNDVNLPTSKILQINLGGNLWIGVIFTRIRSLETEEREREEKGKE